MAANSALIHLNYFHVTEIHHSVGVKYTTQPGAKGGRRLSRAPAVTPRACGGAGWGRAVPWAAVDRSALPLKHSAQAAL